LLICPGKPGNDMWVQCRTQRQFFVFALAGPPIGGIVAWLAMGALSMRSPFPFVTGSSPEGMEFAAGVGLLTGVGALLGATSVIVPIATALLVNLLMFALTAEQNFASPAYWEAAARVARVFLPSSLTAAVACWFLTRRLFDGSTHG
jgi:hypothetical protein